MEKLTYQFNNPEIEINGVSFVVLKSDGEIFEILMALENDLSRTKASNNHPDAATHPNGYEMYQKINEYADSVFGQNALKKMNDGKQPGLSDSIAVLLLAFRACSRSYASKVAAYE